MADEQRADPDPALTQILAEDAELERRTRELELMDFRTYWAMVLGCDPDEAERLFSALCAAKTDEEIDRVLDKISPRSACTRSYLGAENISISGRSPVFLRPFRW